MANAMSALNVRQTPASGVLAVFVDAISVVVTNHLFIGSQARVPGDTYTALVAPDARYIRQCWHRRTDLSTRSQATR